MSRRRQSKADRVPKGQRNPRKGRVERTKIISGAPVERQPQHGAVSQKQIARLIDHFRR